MKNVILIGILIALIVTGTGPELSAQVSRLEKKIDSLFIIASSGEVTHRDQNEPAMDSIAALGQPAVPFLIEKFSTKSARERWTVIWILQRIGSPAVPDLVRALDRADALIVQRVCWALGDIKDSAAVEPLMNIANHADWQVRGQSVRALGRIRHSLATPVIMTALEDTVGQVRKSAVVAARQVGVAESIPRLVQMLSDSFYGARLEAVESLMALDTPQVIAAIADVLDAGPYQAGNLGCDVLGRLATDAAVDILAEQVRADDPVRRGHAAVALLTADPEDNCGYHRFITVDDTDRILQLKLESVRAMQDDEQR